MNNYIERTKDAILDYLTAAQRAEAKIAEGKKIYQADAMEREEKRLRSELLKARKAAEEKIDGIYQEASTQAREWSRLDGEKLTLDAELLKDEGVTPREFDFLVDKYRDTNYTMLSTLRKYGERKNKEAAKEAREAGNPFPLQPYNVRDIPGPDAKMQELDNIRKRADYFLNVADGTGFTSEFEKEFARSTADKAFEAWGEKPQEEPPADPGEITKTFLKGWGISEE